MVLTKEQRIELLAKARAAKQTKNKKDTPEVVVEPPPPEPPAPKPKKPSKKVPIPVPVQVIEESDEEEPEPVIEEVVVAKPKKKLPVKWLKKPEEPVKVCCNEPLTKEEPLITDEKPNKTLTEKHIAIPPEKELKKPRKPRASVRSLDLVAEPKPIEEVFEEVKNNDVKYRPVQKIKAQPAPQEVIIKHHPLGFTLFDY